MPLKAHVAQQPLQLQCYQCSHGPVALAGHSIHAHTCCCFNTTLSNACGVCTVVSPPA